MSVSRQSAPKLIAGQGGSVQAADILLTPAADSSSVAGDILSVAAELRALGTVAVPVAPSLPEPAYRALLAVAEAAKEHVQHCGKGQYRQDLLTLIDALEVWEGLS